MIGKLLIPDPTEEDFMLELLSQPTPIPLQNEETAKLLYCYLVKPAKIAFNAHKAIPFASHSPSNIADKLARKLEEAFPLFIQKIR